MLQMKEYFYRLQGDDAHVKKRHFHNDIELIHIVHGSGTLLKNDKTYTFQDQSIFMIDARNAHIVYPENTKCNEYTRNKIVIKADTFIKFCADLGILDAVTFLFSAPPVSAASHQEIDQLFKTVHTIYQNGEENQKGFAHRYIIELVEWLYDQATHSHTDVTNTTIQRILNVITEKNDVTNVTEISEILHHDKYYISHLFKEKTGTNLSEYLAGKIYQKSRNLLRDTTYSIEQIAFLCGFSAASSFSRFFKSMSGVSPSAFRKESR